MLQRPPRFIRTCAHCLTALACAAAAQAPPVAAQEPAICTVEIRLTQIACAEANDETEKSGARGEYHLRLGTGAEVGPFELRAGEASSFNPGILLDVIDTGILEPADGDELMLPIELYLSAREADSGRPGEDDTDDLSAPLRIAEHVVCPGGTTSITRMIEIEPSVSERPGAAATRAARRKGDRLKLSLKLIIGK